PLAMRGWARRDSARAAGACAWVAALVAAQIQHRFLDGCLDELAVPFDLSEQHGALYHRNTKVRQFVLTRIGQQTTAGFFLDEEFRDLRLHDLEDQTEILADEFIFLRDLVADRSKRTSTCHLEALLQAEVRGKPALEVLP